MKQCRKCGAEFDGKARRECATRRSREWCAANPERAREIKRRYRETHHEQERAADRCRDADKRAKFPEYVSRRIHDGWPEEDAVAAPLGVTRAKWNQMKEAAA